MIISYKIEYIAVTGAKVPLFIVNKYEGEKIINKAIGGYLYAGEAENLVTQILAGEKEYVIVPKEVKSITFH